MKKANVESMTQYDITLTDPNEKVVVPQVRMRERGLVAMLEVMCGATQENVDEFVTVVESEGHCSFRGRLEPRYILQARACETESELDSKEA